MAGKNRIYLTYLILEILDFAFFGRVYENGKLHRFVKNV